MSSTYMKNLRLIFFLLVTFGTSSLVISQYCSNKIEKIEIICSSIEKANCCGSQLTCDGGNSIKSTFSDTSVSSVVHNNNSEVKNLPQITALTINHATVKFIPSGIGKQFTNLKVLFIRSSGLLSVNKNNLKEFGSSLNFLDLYENKITSIDADLFEYNPNMEVIALDGNPFRHIEPEFFTNLKKFRVERIDIRSRDGCIYQHFETSSGHNIATFKWNNEKCIDSTAKLETVIQYVINNDFKCLHENINNLKVKMIEHNQNTAKTSIQQYNSMQNSIKALENSFESSNNNGKAPVDSIIEKKLENLSDKLNKILEVLNLH